MRFFDFVEQYYRIRLPADRFGQLAAFIVAYISRRRAHQTRNAMLLLIFAHVDAGHHAFVVEEELRQCFRQLRFSHTGSTEEDKRTDGAFRILQACAAPAHGIGYGLYGFILSDYTFVEFFFQMQQFVLFTLQHLAYGNSGPPRNHIGDVLRVHFLFDHRFVSLHFMQLFLCLFDFPVQFLKFSVTYFGHFPVVAFALGFIRFEFQILYFHLVLLYLVHQRLFALPFRFVRGFLFFQFGKFFAYSFEFRYVVLTFDGFSFNLQLFDFPGDFVQLFRYGVDLHTQLGCRFIHQVDGLVGEEAVGNVSTAQLYGSNDGIVFDAHVVMIFITFFQSAKNGDGAERIRLVDHHNLETSFQSFVFFKILLVFVQSRCPDRTEFPTRQRRLEDVGGIHRSFAFPGAYQRMNLVDEQNDVAIRLLHFVDNRLQSFLKLSFVFCACHESAHIQRVDLFVFQVLRNVAPQNAVSQPLDNGRFTRTRFTY